MSTWWTSPDSSPERNQGELPRRLDPNWDAIRWLEDKTQCATEVDTTSPLGGLVAVGWYLAKHRGMYPRRMFDIFQLDQTDRVPQEYRDPCSACLDFSRSWTCTDPHDQKQHGWPRVAEVELASLRERVGAQGDLVRSFFMHADSATPTT